MHPQEPFLGWWIPVSILVILITSSALYLKYQNVKKNRGHPLPPGPAGWPIIGNAFDIPLDSTGPAYATWAKQFGSDIVSTSAFGTTMVIIDSYRCAVELLEKRAAKYSSRPVSVMATEFMGFDFVIPFLPYSEKWRENRKLFVKYFGSHRLVGGVHVSHTYEFVNRFLVDLNETPSEFYELVRHMVGSLAICLAYGLPVQRKHDELVAFIDSMGRTIGDELAPGKALVDTLSWLKHLPEWLPGMGFKRHAKRLRWMSDRLKLVPYERAEAALGTGHIQPSFLSNALGTLDAQRTSDEQKAKDLDAIQSVAATVFGAAADTTSNAILIFIFALATRDDFRKRIQEELDLHLIEKEEQSGKSTLRMPLLEDQDKFPHLMAAIMEAQRWAPIAPIGLPHQTTEDDEYEGYFIPKGSVVIANQWSMLNSEKEYGHDVLDFNPDRFLRPRQTGKYTSAVEINPDIQNPFTIAFGFGRRICPGSHIAQSTVWLTAACLLTLYDFEAPELGRPNYINTLGKVDEKFDPGFLCLPKKFKCDFRLRSEEAKVLIGELGMGM